MASDKDKTLARIADSLARIETLLTHHFAPPTAAQLTKGQCWRWQATVHGGQITAIPAPQPFALDSLIGIDDAVRLMKRNTEQFINGKPALHALLTGGRGCGKSSLIRGLLSHYHQQGLRLIETDTQGLAALAHLTPCINERAKRGDKFIIYCDDLSFPNSNAPHFAAMKSAIEGALLSANHNHLIYATSNRRHLVSETFDDNLAPLTDSGELQPTEAIDEKIALADRFGIWIPFYHPNQDDYDAMVKYWLKQHNIRPTPQLLREARQYADSRGTFNGRMAHHFATLTASKKRG